MLLNVLDNRVRNQVPDAEVLLQEQANLGGAYIILDHLADNPDVVLILPERGKGFVDIGPGALNDKSAVLAEDRIKVPRCPQPGLTWYLSVCVI